MPATQSSITTVEEVDLSVVPTIPAVRSTVLPTIWHLVDKRLVLDFHPGQGRGWANGVRFLALLAGTQGGKCDIIGTMVLMQDGTRKPIETLRIGDTVLSLGPDLKITTNRVTGSFDVGVKPVVRVTTMSGRSIEVARTHPLLSVTGWQQAKDFETGSRIAIPRGYREELGVEELPDDELKIVGYLMGDGGLTNGSPIFTNPDIALVDDLASCLPDGIALRPTGDKNGISYRLSGDRLGGQHNPIIEICRKWDIWGSLSKAKRMPELAFRLSRRSLAVLIRAFFDCDATVSSVVGKGVEIVLASEGMIDDLQHLLLRFGIVARKKYKPATCEGKRFDSWRLSINSLSNVEAYRDQIGFIGPKRYRLDCLIERKRAISRHNGNDAVFNFPLGECWLKMGTREYKKSWADEKGYNLLRACRENPVARGFADDLAQHFGVGQNEAYSDIYWDTVQSVESIGDQPCWDIEVENDHNYIGGSDIFSHNSSFAPWWLAREIERTADLAGGSNDYLAITATFDLFKLKFLPLMLECFVEVLGIGRYWASDRLIELSDPRTGEFWATHANDPMWGRIILRAASSPGGLESATAKAAVLDEAGQDAYTMEIWEAVRRRLSLSRGRALLPTTVYNLGWLKEAIYDRAKRVGTPHEKFGDHEFGVEHFDSIENPAFPIDEFELARTAMPAWRFDMMYRGLFTRPAGQIYDCWIDDDLSQGGHKMRPRAIPEAWHRVAGIDFGVVNTAIGLYAVVEDKQGYPTGRLILYRTYHAGSRNAGEHVAKIREIEPNIELVTGGAASEDQWRRAYLWAGMPVYAPTTTEVEVGIDTVYGATKANNLIVFDTEQAYIKQRMDYSRELDDSGVPTLKIKNKEKFHLLDQERYLSILMFPGKPFLPFVPRQHLIVGSVAGRTLPLHWELVAGCYYREGAPSAFVLCAIAENGMVVADIEYAAPGIDADAFGKAMQDRIKAAVKQSGIGNRIVPRDTEETRAAIAKVRIATNEEAFMDWRTDRVVGPSIADRWTKMGLTIIKAEGDGANEWSSCAEWLRSGKVRINRFRCPRLSLTLGLVVADPKETDKPDRRGPVECPQALCNALMLRPRPTAPIPDPTKKQPGIIPDSRLPLALQSQKGSQRKQHE